jgi:hypothetical protein
VHRICGLNGDAEAFAFVVVLAVALVVAFRLSEAKNLPKEGGTRL